MVAFSVFTYQCPNGQCGQLGGYFSSVLLLNTATMQVEALNTPPVISVAWSPDGRKIALVLAHVGTHGRGALGTVSADGSGLKILAMSLGSYSAEAVTWSPDSRMLALVLSDENACPWYCDTAIAVVSADATNLKLLDRARTLEDVYIWGTPVWSPDGTSVAYTITKGDECFLYEQVPCGTEVAAARVDDGAKILLVPNGGFPSWRR